MFCQVQTANPIPVGQQCVLRGVHWEHRSCHRGRRSVSRTGRKVPNSNRLFKDSFSTFDSGHSLVSPLALWDVPTPDGTRAIILAIISKVDGKSEQEMELVLSCWWSGRELKSRARSAKTTRTLMRHYDHGNTICAGPEGVEKEKLKKKRNVLDSAFFFIFIYIFINVLQSEK